MVGKHIEAGVSANLQEPSFAERWVGAKYTYSGVFILDGEGLTPERAHNDLLPLYETGRMHRVRKWPRGIARFILVPVYCARSFQKETFGFLYGYHRPARFGILMKPVLYNLEGNRVEAKDAPQNDTLMYYWYLKILFADGISKAAKHFGHKPELTRDSHDERDLRILEARQRKG